MYSLHEKVAYSTKGGSGVRNLKPTTTEGEGLSLLYMRKRNQPELQDHSVAEIQMLQSQKVSVERKFHGGMRGWFDSGFLMVVIVLRRKKLITHIWFSQKSPQTKTGKRA